MSWFNKNEYKTFLKQRLKEEKKRFKVALDIEKYRIKSLIVSNIFLIKLI